jgi:hypothetical protein
MVAGWPPPFALVERRVWLQYPLVSRVVQRAWAMQVVQRAWAMQVVQRTWTMQVVQRAWAMRVVQRAWAHHPDGSSERGKD